MIGQNHPKVSRRG